MGGQGGGPEGWRAQNFAFFSLSRRNFISCLSLSLLGVLSLNFGGVFEGRDPQMHVRALGLSGETPDEKCGGRRKKERNFGQSGGGGSGEEGSGGGWVLRKGGPGKGGCGGGEGSESTQNLEHPTTPQHPR